MEPSMYEFVQMDENLPMRIIHLDSADKDSLYMSLLPNIDIDTTAFVPPHWHRSIEMTYVVKGGVKLRLGNETQDINAGAFLFVNSGDIHEISNVPGHELEIICFIISYDYLKVIEPKIDSMRFDLNQSETTHPLLKDKFLKIRTIHYEDDPYKHLRIRSVLNELLYLLFCNYQILDESIINREINPNQNQYKAVLEYIHTHYADNLSLEIVANEYHLSREHFSRRFKEMFGRTFLEYLIDYRIYRAFPDVVNSDDMIETISQRHGFPSSKGFITQFKKRYNMSPNTYRKEYQISIIDHRSEEIKDLYSKYINKRP